jgi:hypothetical protein
MKTNRFWKSAVLALMVVGASQLPLPSDAAGRNGPTLLHVTWEHVLEDTVSGPWGAVKTTNYYLDGADIGNGKNGIGNLKKKIEALHGDKADLVISANPIFHKDRANLGTLPPLLTTELRSLIELCRGLNVRLIIDPSKS